MVELDCPIREMAITLGLPDCNLECTDVSESGPVCAPTLMDSLLTNSGSNPQEAKSEDPPDMLTELNRIKLTIFDKIE